MDAEQMKARIAELEAALKERSSLPGVPEALEADVKRRVTGGLPLHHAIQAARSQAENDARVAREEAEAKKAKSTADKAENEKLAAANKRIAELEAQIKKAN
ncbi:MAG TPA: hypothetical protein VM680_18575 [Verrucomicrobiae bacterium]|nr:hypothetical protein [Verrucomicrobiae bacterium]